MATQTAEKNNATDQNSVDLRNYYVQRLALLDRDRLSYWGNWRDLAAQFSPRRGKFFQTGNDFNRGARKDRRIINNTGLLSARIMASGMMAGISSPARPWFKLKFANDEANDQGDGRAWLDEVQKRILHVFAKSNLYNCLHTLYGELGVFGTGAIWVDEDEEDIVRGYTLTVGEYWLASSQRLAVDTLYRTMWWTVRQIVAKFGRENCSSTITAAYDNGQLDIEYEIVHAVEPNPNAAAPDVRKGGATWNGHIARKMPYRSVWFERGTQGEHQLLRASGYEEFCCMAPRWEIAGNETYGGGPGWVALGDSQSLQVIERTGFEVAQKISKPPMIAHPSMKNDPLSQLPGGVTYDPNPEGKGFRIAYEIRGDAVRTIDDKVMRIEDRIKKAFYADLFLMMAESDRREITAREIDERHEEKMLMLGPVLERLHDELLQPLVERVYNIMVRNNMIPPAPQGLEGGAIQIEFISMLAQAQKAVATVGIERYVQFGGQLASIGRTDALDRIDVDGTMDAYSDMLGVPAGVVTDLKKAQEGRAAAAQKVQAAESLAAAQSIAATGEAASKIDVGGGVNAVQAMLGGAPSQ